MDTLILNVTYNGLSHDLTSPIPSNVEDLDVKRIAAEDAGLPPDTFVHYVVDRFPETGKVYLRPKVPFG